MIWVNINTDNLKDWFENKDQFDKIKSVAELFDAQQIMGVNHGQNKIHRSK